MLIKVKVKNFFNKTYNFLKPVLINFFKSFLIMMQKGRWLVSFILTTIICIFCIAFIDRTLALYLKQNLKPHTEGFYKTITDIGLMGWWLGLAVVLWLFFISIAGISISTEDFEKNMQKARSFLFMISSILASALTVTVLKVVFGRFRPRYLFNEELYGFSPFNFNFAMNSFPSGHTISIFTAMMALKFIFPRYDIAYLFLAILVALSRVFTTVHYLSDVIMGAYLAIAITFCIRSIFEEDGTKVAIKCERDKNLF